MLLLASEAAGKTRVVTQVARRLGLNPNYYTDAVSLDRQMTGTARRLVLMTQRDLTGGTVAVVSKAAARLPLGLIVCAQRKVLRLREQEYLVDELAGLDNLEWLPPRYTEKELYEAARECRRRLLRISGNELERALADGELTLRYQPKVQRGPGGKWVTIEAEALLRWQHPRHGRLGPVEFLPEIEAFGLMPAVSDFVLRETAAQLVEWRSLGLEINACINLASSLLNHTELPARYEAILGDFGLDPGSFTFEVIEQDIASSDAPHLRVLGALRERGFRISLDDFGVAAASLGTFEQLPVDEIKIHAEALQRARSSDVAQKVLAAVTGLAHNLGIAVCAEGVGDIETCEFLKNIECDKLQGHLISEAVTPDLVRAEYRAESVESVA